MIRRGDRMRRLVFGMVWLLATVTAQHVMAQAMNWVKVTSYLTERHYHAMAYDVARGQVVLFGGWDGSCRNDTWVWDGTNWVRSEERRVGKEC